MASHRRLGGGPPQRGGNRQPTFSQHHHHPFQGGNSVVNPWQGNLPQNASSNANSMNQAGLLGQLAANPQQLALALSNLLQPQQQHHINNNPPPPSLLSLNTAPAFSHQDSRDSINRFGNRNRSDFRRNEPYNKNRNGGWRQLESKNMGGSRNSRPPFNSRRRSPPRQPQQKTSSDNVKRNKTERKDHDEVKSEIVDHPDEEGVEETKRGWKEEKKIDIKKEHDVDDEENNKNDEEHHKSLDGKYYGVPQKFLHCFVCNKDMWDGESFQKHVRGRAHKQMLQSLEESFHITVSILRENMRLGEEKKVIELNRMHRLNKNKYNRNNKFQEPESHCNMCDLKFLGKIITHRKTEGHQRLKRFLHPNCDICHKEFPSRMDWVDHRLTPEHLRQLNENLEKKIGGEDGEIVDLEIDLEPLMEESMQMEEDNPILELSDDLSNMQNRIPAYKKDRVVAKNCLKEFSGFMCEICHRSFVNEELAQEHLKTQKHYYAFIEAVKLKFKKQSETEAAEREALERKRKRDEDEEEESMEKEVDDVENENQPQDEEMYDPEEACNNEEEEKIDEVQEAIPAEVVKEEAEVEDVPIKPVEVVLLENIKEEIESPIAVSRPPRRAAAAAGGGAVKNGAGPKSKKARKQM